jgi:hypothetical protein
MVKGPSGFGPEKGYPGNVHYKPDLSSERAPHKQTRNCLKIITEKRRKIGRRYQMGA